jgi:hypothetical protein
MTEDLDVTVFLDEHDMSEVVSCMRQEGFELRVPDVDDFVAQTRVLPLMHRTTRMPVDLVVGGPGLEELFLAECERMTIGEVSLLVPRAEHLIVMKLLAGRPHDMLDAEAIAGANPIDVDVIDELTHALSEALGEHEILAHWIALRRRVRVS